jgi:hypothetical protein
MICIIYDYVKVDEDAGVGGVMSRLKARCCPCLAKKRSANGEEDVLDLTSQKAPTQEIEMSTATNGFRRNNMVSEPNEFEVQPEDVDAELTEVQLSVLADSLSVNVRAMNVTKAWRDFYNVVKGEDIINFIIEEGVSKSREEAHHVATCLVKYGRLKASTVVEKGGAPSPLSRRNSLPIVANIETDESEDDLFADETELFYIMPRAKTSPVMEALDREKVLKLQAAKKKEEHNEALRQMLQGRSLCCLSPHNRARVWIAQIAASEGFEKFVLVLIGVSCVALVLDRPGLDPDSTEAVCYYWLDVVLTGLFTIELVMKTIAMGVAFTPNSYLSDNWNRYDLF